MTADEVLFSHAEDLKNQCVENSMLTSTSFLDVHSRSLISPLEKVQSRDAKTFYYGGYDGAERVIAVFVPSFFEIESISQHFLENEDENPLTLLKVSKDKFSNLTHRDYLGALMGLGVKRELLGDILVEEDFAFIICLSSISKFICDNLSSVGCGSVTVEKVSFNLIKSRQESFEEISAFVQSLRLDNIVSATFELSRTAAVMAIEKGVVYLDGVQCEKPDKQITVGAKLVLRGKGKAVFDSVDGKSKKGRLHIKIKRYK